jgi:transcriptional regulator with XRE-family HTH domain
MKLDAYLNEHGLTSERFGKAAGIPSKQTIHNYRRGIRFPSPQNLRRIREATHGAVTADDFVDQHTETVPPVPQGRRDPIIDEAIAIANGPTALARKLGINLSSLYSWKRVPEARVLAVEAATGIPRTRLRPDLHPPVDEVAAHSDRLVA